MQCCCSLPLLGGCWPLAEPLEACATAPRAATSLHSPPTARLLSAGLHLASSPSASLSGYRPHARLFSAGLHLASSPSASLSSSCLQAAEEATCKSSLSAQLSSADALHGSADALHGSEAPEPS